MSGTAWTSDTSEEEETLQFVCRKCPGRFFSAKEKDEHRRYHRLQRLAEGPLNPKSLPKPKPPRKPRSPSPIPSDECLFVNSDVASEDLGMVTPPKKRTRSEQQESREDNETPPTPVVPRKQRRSVKKYNDAIIGSWSNGNGA